MLLLADLNLKGISFFYSTCIYDMHHDPIVLQGAAGPSGVDAYAWRRFYSSFKSASADLCNALAGVARRLCTSRVDPEGLSGFVAGTT